MHRMRTYSNQNGKKEKIVQFVWEKMELFHMEFVKNKAYRISTEYKLDEIKTSSSTLDEITLLAYENIIYHCNENKMN